MSDGQRDDNGIFEPVWNRLENRIDPFGDTSREVLPHAAWTFIVYFARQAKGPFFLLLLIGGLAGIVDAALYWSLGWLVDTLDASSPATLIRDHFWSLAGLLALVLLARTVVLIAAVSVEQQVIVPAFFTRVRWQSFRRVIEQPYAFYQNDFAGRIATKVMQGSASVGDFIIALLQVFWSFMTFIVLTITILMTLDPMLGFVVAVWLMCYLAIAWFLMPKLRDAGRRLADERSVVNGRMVDAFTNIMAVKLFDSGEREHSFVREGMTKMLVASRNLTRMITTVRSCVAVLNGLLVATVGWIAVSGWIDGTVTTGSIAAAMGLVLRLTQMSGWIMFSINGLIRNFATVQDATWTISVEPAIKDRIDAIDLPAVSGDIRFENVTFHYGKDDGVIQNFNLHIKPGERIALVGPSGGGKTTIVNLLLRLFDVEGGRILIDGADLRDVTQASLRAQFGVVAQDPVLMHRSIRDNIAYGKQGASNSEVVAAAQAAQAHHFIKEIADPKGREGYDAHVGERGVKLSGGQRQRIAIARMILKDAPILLLDEATSSLDSEIEAAIQDNLARLMDGKTVIAVAHRLSTIAALDRLIVIDNGEIVEEGDHETLIARGGLYAKLWHRQSGGFLGAELAAE
ncbi:MAG: ABC transporter ATP-binding protein [Rhizobiaceae bacterium]